MVFTCPESPFLWEIAKQELMARTPLLLNVGAHFTSEVRGLVKRANLEGGVRHFVWARHLGCVEAQQVHRGTDDASNERCGLDRELVELVRSGAFEGYTSVLAVVWEEARHSLHVVYELSIEESRRS